MKGNSIPSVQTLQHFIITQRKTQRESSSKSNKSNYCKWIVSVHIVSDSCKWLCFSCNSFKLVSEKWTYRGKEGMSLCFYMKQSSSMARQLSPLTFAVLFHKMSNINLIIRKQQKKLKLKTFKKVTWILPTSSLHRQYMLKACSRVNTTRGTHR